eukprot:361196-Chlamydomonas_euryale.AAC.7
MAAEGDTVLASVECRRWQIKSQLQLTPKPAWSTPLKTLLAARQAPPAPPPDHLQMEHNTSSALHQSLKTISHDDGCTAGLQRFGRTRSGQSRGVYVHTGDCWPLHVQQVPSRSTQGRVLLHGSRRTAASQCSGMRQGGNAAGGACSSRGGRRGEQLHQKDVVADPPPREEGVLVGADRGRQRWAESRGEHLGEQAVLRVEQRDGAVRQAAEPVAAGFWKADHYPIHENRRELARMPDTSEEACQQAGHMYACMPSPPARHSRNGTAFWPGACPPPRPESLAACATSTTLTATRLQPRRQRSSCALAQSPPGRTRALPRWWAAQPTGKACWADTAA